MKILTSFNEFLSKNRKNIIYILWFLVVFFVLSDLTFAWGWETAPSWTNDKDKNQVISALNEALKAISVVLTLWTNFVWWFLYPEWTSWKIIWIDQTLKTLWIMVSNVVYFLFAWIFVWIAFMNIVWKDWDTYELKKAIPRFIIWVLIVPFSWFFVQFIISISNIFTAAILSLPMTDELYQNWAKKTTEMPVKVCEWGYTIKTWTQKALKNDKETAKTMSWSSSWSNYVVICNKENSKSLSEVLTGNWIYSVMYFYTFSVMKFDNYWKLFSWDLIKWVNDVVNLIFKTGFSIIFIVVYAILVIALWLALFVRILRLWFFALFSPVFWLLYFFKKDGWWDGVVKNFSLKNFIWLALVPVYVSAALAFWIIFILTADTWLQKSWLVSQSEDKKSSCINLLPSDVSKSKSTRVCWDWVYHDENSSKSIDAFKWFVWSFWNFLLQIFGIIFLWVWVMAALKSSDITKEVVDPISKFWDSIWDLMKKAPTYAPIFPGGLSAQGLSTAWQSFSSAVHNEYTWKWSKFWSEIAKNMWFWNQALSDIKEIISKKYDTDLDKRKWMNDLLSKIDTSQLWDSWYRTELSKAFKHLWATADLETAIKVEWTSKEQLSRILDQKWEEKWWEAWQKWAWWLFVWKSAEQIASMIWTWWSSSSNNSTTSLPESISKNEASSKNGNNVFNVYALNDKWEKVPSKEVSINVKDWKVSWDIVEALKTYKDIKWKDWIKQILKDMLIEETEIKRILWELWYK